MSTDTSSTRTTDSTSQLTEYRHAYDVVLGQSYSTCTEGELQAEAWSDDNSTATLTSVKLSETSLPRYPSTASGETFFMDIIFELGHLPKITFSNEVSLEQAKRAFILGRNLTAQIQPDRVDLSLGFESVRLLTKIGDSFMVHWLPQEDMKYNGISPDLYHHVRDYIDHEQSPTFSYPAGKARAAFQLYQNSLRVYQLSILCVYARAKCNANPFIKSSMGSSFWCQKNSLAPNSRFRIRPKCQLDSPHSELPSSGSIEKFDRKCPYKHP
ncbi:hypothetical protein FFLO_07064 [Filobasidium floriforme]|uniref:Uncharacterized protein n=1 Tax=Filobasidium floriforme TaxID=5210 RepID=A0A8K0JDQ2_9TREE|nr:hypothetical protein FFLO_07064 [Filobasidium floriforme]